MHVTVHGRVQGVGFRFSAVDTAKRIGVTGWVRNNYDGTVEAFCEGESSKVDKYVDWLKKGPPTANVTRVDVKEISYKGRYNTFAIAY